MPLAQPHERAGLRASIYRIAYLANSAPALIAGYLVGRVGLIDTTRIYGDVVIVLAGVGFATPLLPHERDTDSRELSERAGELPGRNCGTDHRAPLRDG